MNERYARIAIAAVFFLYVLLIRTFDIANAFLMLGDQVRDWTIALAAFSELPLTGPPSLAGGRSFGPIYYWVLWLGRVTIGPFTDNLPHAGGLTVALVQSLGDVCLLVALWRRLPLPLAIAGCLMIASAPFDVGISAVIWNPPVAAGILKVATAAALTLGDSPAPWRIALTAALAWLSVQAHISAIVIATPLLAALVARPAFQQRWRQAGLTAAGILAIVLVMQVPYFVAISRSPDSPAGPTTALNVLAESRGLQIVHSFNSVIGITGGLVAGPNAAIPFSIITLVIAAVVVVSKRRDVMALGVSVGALATAVGVFALWTRPYDSYWFQALTTALVLSYLLAIAAIPPPRAALGIGYVLLAGVVLWQPSRIAESRTYFSYPPYRAMRLASRELAVSAPVLRDIRVTFEVHPGMDKYFMYRILGGRIDPAAAQTAFVNADGSVRIK